MNSENLQDLPAQLEEVRERLWDIREEEALLRLSEAAIMNAMRDTTYEDWGRPGL